MSRCAYGHPYIRPCGSREGQDCCWLCGQPEASAVHATTQETSLTEGVPSEPKALDPESGDAIVALATAADKAGELVLVRS